MCKICEIKPVYEFTNKRKVCKNCFIRYFQKKVLYTIRKFKMIDKNNVIGYEYKRDFRSVVLENVLNMFSEKSPVKIVKLPKGNRVRRSAYPKEGRVPLRQVGLKEGPKLRNKGAKIAIPLTIDLEANKIVNELIKGDSKNLKDVFPKDKKIIKPLYLFTDKEVLLYAKLKRLIPPFHPEKLKINKDKISEFVEELEKKHPEVKRAIVNSFLALRQFEDINCREIYC